MKFAYKFSNLLGTVYRKGNLIFTPDGNSVISPVGNRLTIYDLKNNKVKSVSPNSRYNYTVIDISPNGAILLAGNEFGEVQMISMISHTVISTYKFSKEVKCIKFSPDGKYFAICKENMVMIFNSPGSLTGEYQSFVLKRSYYGAYDDIIWVDWTSDSRIFAAASKDNTTKIYAVDMLNHFRVILLGGHTEAMVGCFFDDNSLNINTIGKNGQLSIWRSSIGLNELTPMEFIEDELQHEPIKKKQKEEDEESDDDFDKDKDIEKDESTKGKLEQNVEFTMGTEGDKKRDGQGKLITSANIVDDKKLSYKRLARHNLAIEPKKENFEATLTAVTYHKKTKLLVTAFSTGAFYLHELPDVNLIHSLSISDYQIGTVVFNSTGDWIALGVAGLGQLLVWEWQSEQYIMKQQGHSSEMNCLAYSPDGQYIVTGSEDSKIKLWNTQNGFCIVTFSEHTSSVTAVQFSQNKKFLVSASLDGTVRAYDIVRYRNFKTFTSPVPVQISCVALDYSGELVAAGGQDIFEIYLWSLKLGRLLEVLSGHEGPVTSLAFAPLSTSSMMVSGSWDETIKIWNCLESSGNHETIDLISDVVSVAFHPNGEEVAVATLNGNISVFHTSTTQQIASIEGRSDLGSGVSDIDIITAKKNLQAKCFTTIAYSADGDCLLAAGKSKNVCIYHVKEGILLKKFEITENRSFDGLDEFINRRNITEFGNMALVEERNQLEGGNVNIRLPGVLKGDMASRNFKPEVKVFCIRFSPTGLSWAAACTEGLLIYSLDKGIVFDPYQLSLEVTPKAARENAKSGNFSTGLIMALKLNEFHLIHEVIERISPKDVGLVVSSLPNDFADRILDVIAKLLSSSHHVEYYLKWACAILTYFGPKENVLPHHSLLALHQSLSKKYESLSKVCDFNKYTLRVLKGMANSKAKAEEDQGIEYDIADEQMILVSTNDKREISKTNGKDNDDESDDAMDYSAEDDDDSN